MSDRINVGVRLTRFLCEVCEWHVPNAFYEQHDKKFVVEWIYSPTCIATFLFPEDGGPTEWGVRWEDRRCYGKGDEIPENVMKLAKEVSER